MHQLTARLRRLYRRMTDRRGYFGARLLGIRVPVFPLMHLPDGFQVEPLGETGLTLVERFCTAAEAAAVIELARGRLSESRITINGRQVADDYRRSQTAIVYDSFLRHPAVVPLLLRAGMLLGLPGEHAEAVFVTRYAADGYYKPHADFAVGFDGDRLYTVLVYLNDLSADAGGATAFDELNVKVRPRCGRALIWTNTNPDGSRHFETRHAALPVRTGEKWVVQLWFRSYPMLPALKAEEPAPQAAPGQPLQGGENLPRGIEAVLEIPPDSDYERAFEPR